MISESIGRDRVQRNNHKYQPYIALFDPQLQNNSHKGVMKAEHNRGPELFGGLKEKIKQPRTQGRAIKELGES